MKVPELPGAAAEESRRDKASMVTRATLEHQNIPGSKDSLVPELPRGPSSGAG